MKKWVVLFLIVLVLGGLLAWRFQQNKLRDAAGPMGGGPMGGGGAMGGRGGGGMRGPASVELAVAQVRDIRKTFQATGTVESMQNVKISTKVTGRIEYLQAREGDKVTQGQVLVRIDPTQVQALVRQQQANLAEAKYRLAQAKLTQSSNDTAIRTQIQQQQAALDQAKSKLAQAQLAQGPNDTAVTTQIRQQEANLASVQADFKQTEQSRAASLESINAILDDAQSKVDSANASVANANAGVKSAQANLDNATTKYNRTFDLYKQGFVAAQDVDDARTTMNVQQAAVDTAKGQVQAAQAALGSVSAQKRNAEQQASINRSKLDADLEAARAKVAQAQAALDYARANAQQTPAYEQSLEALRAQVKQAQAALDNAKANTQQSLAYKQNLEALRASVAVAQASLDSAKAQLADTVLHAPMNGVVTARSQDPGALATPSQPILTVQSLNHIWVTIAVPEEVCVKVHLNQPATVAFDALGGKIYAARVAQINPSADLDSRQFTVRVVLDNSNHTFSPGMFAKVNLITEEAKAVVAVPREAVKQDKDGSSYVFVKGADGNAKQQTVATGLSDADWIAITSGVLAKQQVVTMSAMPLRDGQPISAGGGRRGRGGQGGPGQGGGQRGGGQWQGRPGSGGQGGDTGAPSGRPNRGGPAGDAGSRPRGPRVGE